MATAEADMRRIYEAWHAAVEARDLDALMALYAEDSTIESSAVLVLEKDETGVLRGRDRLRAHFAAFFAMVGRGTGRPWFRPGPPFIAGRTLLWEYPSRGPDGQQLDVVESMDVEAGLIVYHRVYWGFVGFKALQAAANRTV